SARAPSAAETFPIAISWPQTDSLRIFVWVRRVKLTTPLVEAFGAYLRPSSNRDPPFELRSRYVKEQETHLDPNLRCPRADAIPLLAAIEAPVERDIPARSQRLDCDLQ